MGGVRETANNALTVTRPDTQQTAIDILVSKAKKKNEDFRRRMAWARTAMQNLHQVGSSEERWVSNN